MRNVIAFGTAFVLLLGFCPWLRHNLARKTGLQSECGTRNFTASICLGGAYVASFHHLSWPTPGGPCSSIVAAHSLLPFANGLEVPFFEANSSVGGLRQLHPYLTGKAPPIYARHASDPTHASQPFELYSPVREWLDVAHHAGWSPDGRCDVLRGQQHYLHWTYHGPLLKKHSISFWDTWQLVPKTNATNFTLHQIDGARIIARETDGSIEKFVCEALSHAQPVAWLRRALCATAGPAELVSGPTEQKSLLKPPTHFP